MPAPKNPKGAKSDKVWRDAIMRAVRRRDSGSEPQALERLADKCVEMALDGDMQAMKEIGDRLDGRPAQAVQGDPDNPLQLVGTITWQPPHNAKSE